MPAIDMNWFTRKTLTAAFFAAGLVAAHAQGANAVAVFGDVADKQQTPSAKDSQTKTNKLTLSSVKLVNDSGIEMGSQTFINTGNGIISLQAPEGCRVKAEGQGRELLIYAQNSSTDFVSVKYEDAGGTLEFDAVRPLVQKQLPGWKFIGEYEAAAIGTNAVGFDLSLTIRGEPWLGKAMVIPAANGRLLVSATRAEKESDLLFFLMQRVISSLAVGTSERALRQTFDGIATP